jgi:ABC-type amino acid transport substrate-binding protein
MEAAMASMLEPGTYEIVRINNAAEAYGVLDDGFADAFVTTDSVGEMLFLGNERIVLEPFFPLIFHHVSMATANPELEPVIAVVNRALRTGAMTHVDNLYEMGFWDYQSYQLFLLLTDEERGYIRKRPPVPVVTSAINYPLSFYNRRENEFQGIFSDLLDEISLLTGLEFTVINDENIDWPQTRDLLISGKAAISPEVGWSPEREGMFLWSNTVITEDFNALISRADFEPITLNTVTHIRTGVARGYTERVPLEELEPVLRDENVESLGYTDRLRLLPESDGLIRQIEAFNFKAALSMVAELKRKLGGG